MDFPTLLRLMAAELDLPGFAPDAQAPCALALEGMAVTFNLHEGGQAFSMRSRVGVLLDTGFEATAARLLAANLGVASPDGSAFSADTHGTVYLTRCLRVADVSPRLLADAVRRFAGRALQWQQALAGPQAPAGQVFPGVRA